MKRLLIVVLLCLFIIGCDLDRPADDVYDCDNMTVYVIKISSNGKYEYYISDDQSHGWVFITDKKFNVGDVINITTK